MTKRLNKALSDLNDIKLAIINEGVDVPSTTDTSDYDDKVREVAALKDEKPYIDTSKFTSFARFFYEGARLECLNKIDTSNANRFDYMFNKCQSLTSIPYIDTSKGTNFDWMFNDCFVIEEINIDTHNGNSFIRAFCNCRKIKSMDVDVSNSINCSGMFSGCENLKTVSNLDFSVCTTLSGVFGYCWNLTNISFTKNSIKYDINLAHCSKLSDESILSIIDGLAKVNVTRKLSLNSAIVEKLTTEQLTTIANKNWSVG